MKKIAGLVALMWLCVALAYPGAQTPPSRPRLVLFIAVDQFRADYLTRFRAEYTSGLQRLLTRGAVFTDAHLEHYPTVTAVGHSTMLTGATPSVSGIIGNDWFDRATGKSVTSVTDTTVTPVGAASGAAASPRRLLVSTLGDEIKVAAGLPKNAPDAPRVFGVSLKDRSAILPAGHSADAAYWWDTTSGRFVTSTYYMPELPAWVAAFNERRLPDSYAGKTWSLLSSPATVLEHMPDAPGRDLYQAVYGSPAGNDVLLAFALELLEKEKLGQRGTTDLLSVSFSSNDAVGHEKGPDSAHVRDITIRTDRTIGALLDRVDKLVGLDNTVVAFTTDHGVAPLPERAIELGLPGGRMTTKELTSAMSTALAAAFGEGRWILGTAGPSPYLDHELIETRGLDAAAVRRVAANAALKVPHVARVYTRDQLLLGQVSNDTVSRRVLRGYHPQRSGDLEVVLDPYWLRQATGTTHGTPYNYDTHIPLIVMGARVRPGEYSAPAALNDLAPTLAALARVDVPSGSVGRVLTEALQAPAPAPTR